MKSSSQFNEINCDIFKENWNINTLVIKRIEKF